MKYFRRNSWMNAYIRVILAFLFSISILMFVGPFAGFSQAFNSAKRLHLNSNRSESSGVKNFLKRFQFEFYGGWSTLNPADLNIQADYNEEYFDFFYRRQYQFYHYILGNDYQLSESREGEFKRIKYGFPFGLRIKYQLTSSFALSAGFKYVSKEEISHVKDQYGVRSVIADNVLFYDDFTRTIENSPHTLLLKGYGPLLGLHFMIPVASPLSIEAFLSGGILHTECRYYNETTYSYSNVYDYWSETVYKSEYKGEGTGVALEAGIRSNIHIYRGIGLFAEGGYSFQNAGRLSGPGKMKYTYKDCDSIETTEPTVSWKGYWGVSPVKWSRQWGNVSTKSLSNHWEKTDPAVKDFKLSLSGFQLRIGFFINLGRV